MSSIIAHRLVGSYGLTRIVIGKTIHVSARSLNKYSAICEQGKYLSQKRFNSFDGKSTTISPTTNSLIHQRQLTPISKELVDTGKSLVQRQSEALFSWYDEVSHTNEVREAHRAVEILQDKLNEAQQLRRDASKTLNDIRYELQTCFADQASCPKGDPRYLELIRREIEISNKEKQKNEEFLLLDKAERDIFILMQSAVKTSHEKEKIHTNSAKYWSIVGSLAGALLGIIATAFSFYNRNNLLSDINKEFVMLRSDTKVIGEQVQLLLNEQRNFLKSQETHEAQETQESWAHWIGRNTYVISIYRYFVPKSPDVQ